MTTEAPTVETWYRVPKSKPWIVDFFGRLRHHPLGMFGLAGIIFFLVLAVFGRWIAPYSPSAQSTVTFSSPTTQHPFGTDPLGRDVMSRVIRAAPTELGVGLTAVFGGVAIATVLGLISGYFGGWADSLIQRIVDASLAFPQLILLMIITSVLTPSAHSVIIALIIGAIAGTARIIRSAVLSVKNNVYIEAARAIGASETRIMVRHILPQITAPIIVIVSIMIPAIALVMAGLNFLGLGLPPPAPTWGGDISGDARTYFKQAPWLTLFPGAALSLYVLSFNLLGDALRDILDPRLRGTGATR